MDSAKPWFRALMPLFVAVVTQSVIAYYCRDTRVANGARLRLAQELRACNSQAQTAAMDVKALNNALFDCRDRQRQKQIEQQKNANI